MTSASAAPAAGPLRIRFVTGNAKKLEEVRPCWLQQLRVLAGSLKRMRIVRQVVAILGTEHAARFVLDAVSLDLPELQARRDQSGASDTQTR
jgi:hypothetical protein